MAMVYSWENKPTELGESTCLKVLDHVPHDHVEVIYTAPTSLTSVTMAFLAHKHVLFVV